MNQTRGLANDVSRVLLDKTEADHAGNKNRSIHGFGVAVHMTEFAREFCGQIRPARRQRAVDVRAELRANSEPMAVVARVASIGGLQVSREQTPGWFARTPRAATILCTLF